MTYIIAIDLSLANTGIAAGTTAHTAHSWAAIATDPEKDLRARWEKIIQAVARYGRNLQAGMSDKVEIWIEQGVSFADRGRTNNDTAELRGGLRWALGPRLGFANYVEVMPDVLKTFATDNRFASKEEMVEAVTGWGYSLPTLTPNGKKLNHNVADALVLYEFARATYGCKERARWEYAQEWHAIHRVRSTL